MPPDPSTRGIDSAGSGNGDNTASEPFPQDWLQHHFWCSRTSARHLHNVCKQHIEIKCLVLHLGPEVISHHNGAKSRFYQIFYQIDSKYLKCVVVQIILKKLKSYFCVLVRNLLRFRVLACFSQDGQRPTVPIFHCKKLYDFVDFRSLQNHLQ